MCDPISRLICDLKRICFAAGFPLVLRSTCELPGLHHSTLNITYVPAVSLLPVYALMEISMLDEEIFTQIVNTFSFH